MTGAAMLYSAEIFPDTFCKFIDVGRERWVAVGDIINASQKAMGWKLARPSPVSVSIVAGKRVDDIYRCFGDFAIDDRRVAKRTSFIEGFNTLSLLKLAQLPLREREEIVARILTYDPGEAQKESARQPDENLGDLKYLRDHVYCIEHALAASLKVQKEQRAKLNHLMNAVSDMAQRVAVLERQCASLDAADAILAEANRLYAKGKAMKATGR